MSTAVAPQAPQTLGALLVSKKNQIAAALPKHLDADRMIRLAMTCVSQSDNLRKADIHSVFRALLLSSQTGLEIGVGGQAYLVPYKNREGAYEAQFVPGWQGIVDLVSRSGRATVWTGAVFEGDEFDWQLGDAPFVRHRPGGENDEEKLTHVYAVGRVNGSHHPVIEVWTRDRVIRHRNKFNKVGNKHYSFVNFEMYARKVALLQVLKYMPKSIEMQKVIAAEHSVTTGQAPQIIEGDFLPVDMMNTPSDGGDETAGDSTVADATAKATPVSNEKPALTDAEFKKNLPAWKKLIEGATKTATEILTTARTKHTISDEQEAVLRQIEADTVAKDEKGNAA